jgi:hypothetical protein
LPNCTIFNDYDFYNCPLLTTLNMASCTSITGTNLFNQSSNTMTITVPVPMRANANFVYLFANNTVTYLP